MLVIHAADACSSAGTTSANKGLGFALQLLIDMRPNEEHAKNWVVKNAVSVAVQAAPEMSEHEVRQAPVVLNRLCLSQSKDGSGTIRCLAKPLACKTRKDICHYRPTPTLWFIRTRL